MAAFWMFLFASKKVPGLQKPVEIATASLLVSSTIMRILERFRTEKAN